MIRDSPIEIIPDAGDPISGRLCVGFGPNRKSRPDVAAGERNAGGGQRPPVQPAGVAVHLGGLFLQIPLDCLLARRIQHEPGLGQRVIRPGPMLGIVLGDELLPRLHFMRIQTIAQGCFCCSEGENRRGSLDGRRGFRILDRYADRMQRSRGAVRVLRRRAGCRRQALGAGRCGRVHGGAGSRGKQSVWPNTVGVVVARTSCCGCEEAAR